MNLRLKALAEEREQARTEANAILAAATSDGDRGLTDDEQVTFDGLVATANQCEADHKAIMDRDKAAATLRQGDAWASQAPPPPGQQHRQPVAQTGPPKQEPEGFSSFGHMLQAVAQAGMTQGVSVDQRLLDPMAAVTGMSEGVGSDGGFLVGTDISSELMKQTYETGVLASRCSRTGISATSNGLRMNGIDETSRVDGSQWGGVVGYWESEAAEKTASKPKFRRIELNLQKLIGLLYSTDELLQDAAALESIIMEAFPNVFGFKLDEAIIRGTGAGQPKGILATGPKVAVAKETGQKAKTITAVNIEAMYARMWSRGLSNSAWFVNQDCWPAIFQLHHVVGTGGVSMFIPAGGISQAPFGTLLGRPIVPIEQAATLGTEGDIMLCDFSQYKLIDKGGIQTDSSIHVRFIYDESVFRFVMRVDGQPMWATALTPAQGTNKVSPFITLATRS
jgi:HK97 family phage major capsid protein